MMTTISVGGCVVWFLAITQTSNLTEESPKYIIIIILLWSDGLSCWLVWPFARGKNIIIIRNKYYKIVFSASFRFYSFLI